MFPLSALTPLEYEFSACGCELVLARHPIDRSPHILRLAQGAPRGAFVVFSHDKKMQFFPFASLISAC